MFILGFIILTRLLQIDNKFINWIRYIDYSFRTESYSISILLTHGRKNHTLSP